MNAAAAPTEVRVPDLGNFKDVAVIDVLVKPGDAIAVDTPLVTLESDKAAMDVPSTADGVVEKVHIAKGGKVNAGDVIVTLKGAAGGAAATAPAPKASAAPPAPPAAAAAAAAAPADSERRGRMVPLSQLGVPTSYRADLAPIDEPGFSRAHASPSVRAFARELGVDLARVSGRGFKGRIT
ncbi:MAG TPA: biotin/lipoyl-containing protein, partial [Steroidobacteraceae bacterium]|nr:biotin/lipoyl-containing protein [Steroidobacteraceae bacterium]